MRFILSLLTWWQSETLGTRLFTWRKGVKVGEDAQGNQYYETRNKKRRWVSYNGEPEASKVPADWHGWLHHTWDEPPTNAPLEHKPWEKQHRENQTGTVLAYAPTGSIRRSEPADRSDYEAWNPE